MGGSVAGAAGSLDAGPDAPVDAPEDAPPDAGCDADRKQCGVDCVGLDDPAFGCGASGCAPCAIPGADARCEAGQCVLDSCRDGFADCNLDPSDGCETDLLGDPDSCGGCGNVCVVNHGTAACQGGLCAVNGCEPEWGDCDLDPSNGCESALDSDPSNCGSCGDQCDAAPGGQPVCINRVCSEKACLTSRGDCNDDSTDACETNLLFDADHCGYCGHVCELPGAVATCSLGECIVESCIPPFEDCDGLPGNGCETDLSRDNALHCGACGRACSLDNGSSAACRSGLCNALCDQGFGDCAQPASPEQDDGCEQDVASDPENCGSCGEQCVLPGAEAGCSGGRCVVASCSGSTADCDADPSNGCETDLDVDLANCGACGRACAADGVAAPSCSGGLCDSACQTGLGNCAKPAAPAPDDGCEQDLQTDPLNCGGCGRRCASDNVTSLACDVGVCTSTCQPGFGNCARPGGFSADDGCELDVTGDDERCGSCDNDCTAQGAAAGSLRCGFVEPSQCGCVGNPGRCRVDSGTNPACPADTGLCECGGVGCRPGEGCVSSGGADVCSCEGGPGCGPTEQCCQNAAGCVDVTQDPDHCGACGRACPAGFACSAGSCGCSGDASCDAGSPGSCGAGICTCAGGAVCAAGQRCLGDGSCG